MNDKNASAPDSVAPAKESLFTRKGVKKILRFWPVAPLAFVSVMFVHMLMDVEYNGNDITEQGLGIFAWARAPVAKPVADLNAPVSPQTLFALSPAECIRPEYIKQGQLCDCKFLAALISFASTDRGRGVISNMVHTQADGSYIVTFPNAKNEPVHVSPLTKREQSLYGCAVLPDGKSAGVWLPILEKAYGQYRNEHLDLADMSFKTIKHGIFENRWTATAELPGFAASYGAGDDQACELLTGHGARVMQTASFEIGDYGLGKGYVSTRQIMSWFRRQAVVRQFKEEQNAWLISASTNQHIAIATTELQGEAIAHGLKPGHAYAVLGYNPLSSTVTLKDPYGEGDFVDATTRIVADGKNDGIFALSLDQFNQYFSRLRVEDAPDVHNRSYYVSMITKKPRTPSPWDR